MFLDGKQFSVYKMGLQVSYSVDYFNLNYTKENDNV